MQYRKIWGTRGSDLDRIWRGLQSEIQFKCYPRVSQIYDVAPFSVLFFFSHLSRVSMFVYIIILVNNRVFSLYRTKVNKKLPPFDQILILRKVVAKWGSNKYLWVFITVVVAFKDTVHIFYYEINLKYCQDSDVYR